MAVHYIYVCSTCGALSGDWWDDKASQEPTSPIPYCHNQEMIERHICDCGKIYVERKNALNCACNQQRKNEE